MGNMLSFDETAKLLGIAEENLAEMVHVYDHYEWAIFSDDEWWFDRTAVMEVKSGLDVIRARKGIDNASHSNDDSKIPLL